MLRCFVPSRSLSAQLCPHTALRAERAVHTALRIGEKPTVHQKAREKGSFLFLKPTAEGTLKATLCTDEACLVGKINCKLTPDELITSYLQPLTVRNAAECTDIGCTWKLAVILFFRHRL